MSEQIISSSVIDAKIKSLWKEYWRARLFIKRHKVAGDKKKSVDRLSKHCPIVIGEINVLRELIGLPSVKHFEMKTGELNAKTNENI